MAVWDPPMNWFEKIYVLLHFPLVVIFYHELSQRNGQLSQVIVTGGVIILLYSLSCMGFILEQRWYAPITECIRCLLFFAIEQILWPVVESIEGFDVNRLWIMYILRVSFLVSAMVCGLISLERIATHVRTWMKTQKIHRN